MTERDERTIHRLEAFSDIVMGFMVAEAGIGLVMPKDEAGLAAMWPGLNLFLLTFLLIASMWWYHHKLFVTYFVINPVSVIMNFVLLAALALGVYFEQVAVHFMFAGLLPIVPIRLWLSCMALVFVLLATMLSMGVWQRRTALAPEDVKWGVNRAARSTFAALALCVMMFAIDAGSHREPLMIAAILALIAGGALRRFIVPRITARLLALRETPAAA